MEEAVEVRFDWKTVEGEEVAEFEVAVAEIVVVVVVVVLAVVEHR